MPETRRFDSDGDWARYDRDRAACRARLEVLGRPGARLLVVGHGDCDGVVSAGLVVRFLEDRGAVCAVASVPEFRDADWAAVAPLEAEAVVLLECQGSSPAWAALAGRALNIDHHPPDAHLPPDLDPRLAGLEPNPANALVVWDLLADRLPPAARWLAAAASAIDRCPAPAASIRAAEAARLARLAEIEDTFVAIQYRGRLCAEMTRLVATLPEPDALLAAEPFAAERARFRAAIEAALVEARAAEGRPPQDGPLVVRVPASPDGPRIASPLATRLGEAYPDRIVAVAETDEAAGRARISFRAANGSVDLGSLLAEAARSVPGADASGHERAASARVPLDRLDEFLSRLPPSRSPRPSRPSSSAPPG